MIKDNGIDEFCGLNSIIKLSSSDLAKNGVAIMSRLLKRTTSRMDLLVTSFGKERNSQRVLDSRYESHGDGKDQI